MRYRVTKGKEEKAWSQSGVQNLWRSVRRQAANKFSVIFRGAAQAKNMKEPYKSDNPHGATKATCVKMRQDAQLHKLNQKALQHEKDLKKRTKPFFTYCQKMQDRFDHKFKDQNLNQAHNEILQHWEQHKSFKELAASKINKVPVLLTHRFDKQVAPDQVPLIARPYFLASFLNYIEHHKNHHAAFKLYKQVVINYNSYKPQHIETILLRVSRLLVSSPQPRHQKLIKTNKKHKIMNKNILNTCCKLLDLEIKKCHAQINLLPRHREATSGDTSKRTRERADLEASSEVDSEAISGEKVALQNYDYENFFQLYSQALDGFLSRELLFSNIMQKGDLLRSIGKKLLNKNAEKMRKRDFNMLPACLAFSENGLESLRCGQAWMKPLVEGLLGPFAYPNRDVLVDSGGAFSALVRNFFADTNSDADANINIDDRDNRRTQEQDSLGHGIYNRDNKKITYDHKKIICDFLIKHFGHPRLNASVWQGIDENCIQVLVRWQSFITIKHFFKVVDNILDKYKIKEQHWKDRKEYWSEHMDGGDIFSVWLCFGKAYNDTFEKENLLPLDLQQSNLEYGKINKSTGDLKHCVLMMETQRDILVEFSHEGALRAYPKNKSESKHPCPKLFQKQYDADHLKAIQRGEKGWFAHSGSGWQEKIDEHVFNRHRKRRRHIEVDPEW